MSVLKKNRVFRLYFFLRAGVRWQKQRLWAFLVKDGKLCLIVFDFVLRCSDRRRGPVARFAGNHFGYDNGFPAKCRQAFGVGTDEELLHQSSLWCELCGVNRRKATEGGEGNESRLSVYRCFDIRDNERAGVPGGVLRVAFATENSGVFGDDYFWLVKEITGTAIAGVWQDCGEVAVFNLVEASGNSKFFEHCEKNFKG